MDGLRGRHKLESLLLNPNLQLLELVSRLAQLQIGGLHADYLHENPGEFAVAVPRSANQALRELGSIGHLIATHQTRLSQSAIRYPSIRIR